MDYIFTPGERVTIPPSALPAAYADHASELSGVVTESLPYAGRRDGGGIRAHMVRVRLDLTRRAVFVAAKNCNPL